jgi:hypothetical protein
MNIAPWVQGFLRVQRAREAIASVSLSHPEGCDRMMCKAAQGDERAFAEMLVVLEGERS